MSKRKAKCFVKIDYTNLNSKPSVLREQNTVVLGNNKLIFEVNFNLQLP